MHRPVNRDAPASETPLARELVRRIAGHGPLTFAEYMEACLYDARHGYYSRAESTRFADYYTSVDVHPVFGRLLARQLAEIWEVLGAPDEFTVAEPGAGGGRLAANILDFAVLRLPRFYRALRYVAVEQGTARRAALEATLAGHRAAGHAASSAELPAEIPVGCIFSNEFFDALPVHRVLHDGHELREYYVNAINGRLAEETAPLSSTAIEEYFRKQAITLQPGQQAEANLAACDWIANAAQRLGRGAILTIDYGHAARELYNELHMRGTMLAYRAHRASEDYYAAPGEQDLTAHVNFTALELWGAEADLETVRHVSQSSFLLALARANDFADLYDPGQSAAEQTRARQQFTTLIHPEGLGETFEVLIQQKGMPGANLTGLSDL